MFYLLMLLGFIAVAAGVFVIGFGVPIRDTPFGAALLMAGSIAITGGFILTGLAAAVRELQRVVQGLKARSAGIPRPVRPPERRDGERRDSGRFEERDRRQEPRLPMPGVVAEDALSVVPPKVDMRDIQPGRRAPEPEWLRSTMMEVESALRPVESASALDNDRAGDVRLQPDPRPSDERQPDAPLHVATPLSDDATTELRRPLGHASADMFDTVWPSERRKTEAAPEQQAEPSSEPQMRSVEANLPSLVPAPAPAQPMRAEPRPVPILKSGVIDEMAYTLFTDGSIEAQMPDGTMRFASIEELRHHLEKNEG